MNKVNPRGYLGRQDWLWWALTLQELQKESSRLKKLVADQALDMLILKEAARPHACVPQVN